MGSTGSLKYYQLSRFPKLKHFHTQVNRNEPESSALLGDTSEARSLWPPSGGHSPPGHQPALVLWASHYLVCYRLVLPLANEACSTFILRVPEKLLLPRILWKKAIVMSVVSWAWASS